MIGATAGRLAGTATLWAAASVLIATALSQHPNRAFDRLRGLDPFGLVLPNWRFFAPIPAMDDYRLLHRVQHADGSEGEWEETIPIAPRTLTQFVWFPDRRREKAVFDMTSELLARIPAGDDAVLGCAAYRTLDGIVRETIGRRSSAASTLEPLGYQFLVARHAGFDERTEPEFLLVSPFVPWNGGAA